MRNQNRNRYLTMDDIRKERAIVLKSLTTVERQLASINRKHPERAALLRQKERLLDELRDLKRKTARHFKFDGAELISDHAVVRWLERKCGIDMNRLRSLIVTEPLKFAIDSADKYWSDGEVVFVIEHGAVQTVIPVNQLNETMA
jgi:hypothetical protein